VKLGVTASIDLSALNHNISFVRKRAGEHREIMAMIKSNAYGHGLVAIAQEMTSVDRLGVATIDEAFSLRQAGISKPIVVMIGFIFMEELKLLFHLQVETVIHSIEQIKLLERFDREKVSTPLKVWLKVDTGMHRLGFSLKDFPQAYRRLSQISIIQQPISLATHLADADNPDLLFTQTQIKLFDRLTHSLPGKKSICNSAAVLAYPQAFYHTVRPGIMLYGISPFPGKVGSALGLKPVMQFSAPIIAINRLRPGDKVGYGGTWQCQRQIRAGVVGVGYGDGYPRHIKPETSVWCKGRLCSILGRVSMNMIVIDLSDQDNVQIGDSVILWGDQLPVEKIACSAGTISYELLTQLTDRVKFNYLKNDE